MSSSPERNSSPSRKPSPPKSPPKFGADAFDRKKKSVYNSKVSTSSIGRNKGLRNNPSDWTKKELLEKLNRYGGKFYQDKKTGVSEFSIDGYMLLADDFLVILEFCRRFTEIQTFTLSRCGLNDSALSQIVLNGLSQLRALQHLNLTRNLLESGAVRLITEEYGLKSTRNPIKTIDLRGNSLTFEDGLALIEGLPVIDDLNGLSIGKLRKDRNNDQMAFPHSMLRAAELGILCGLVAELLQRRIFTRKMDLSRNFLDSASVIQLVRCLEETACVQEIDLSYNPITNNASDFSGLQCLQQFARRSKQLLIVKLDGIAGISPPPPPIGSTNAEKKVTKVITKAAASSSDGSKAEKEEEKGPLMSEQISISTMVNRSLYDPGRFMAFADQLIRARYSRPLRADEEDEEAEQTEDWELPAVANYEFLRANRIALNSVVVTEDNEILLKPQEKTVERFTF